jgi:hypothetical protein
MRFAFVVLDAHCETGGAEQNSGDADGAAAEHSGYQTGYRGQEEFPRAVTEQGNAVQEGECGENQGDGGDARSYLGTHWEDVKCGLSEWQGGKSKRVFRHGCRTEVDSYGRVDDGC